MSAAPKLLPLFVQNALPRDTAIDDAALPYILILDKQAGEWRKIVLVCREGMASPSTQAGKPGQGRQKLNDKPMAKPSCGGAII